MAELLAIVGGVASFLTVAEVTGKLVIACTSLIKDAKNAPKDVSRLVEELEILSKNAEGIESTIRNVQSQDLKMKIDEAVRSALDICVQLMKDLKDILEDYEVRFKRHKASLWWEKVKVVKGKKGVVALLERVERAKGNLILANQIAASIMMQAQGGGIEKISTSVDRIHTQTSIASTKLDEALSKGMEILASVKATEQRVLDTSIHQSADSERHTLVQGQLDQIISAQDQGFNRADQRLSCVQSSSASMSAKINRTVDQGEAIVEITRRTEQTLSRDSNTIQSTHELVEQLVTLINNPNVLVGLVSQATRKDDIRTVDRVREVRSDTETCRNSTSQSSIRQTTESSQSSTSQPPKSQASSSYLKGRQQVRQRLVCHKNFIQNKYISVTSTSWEEDADYDSSDEFAHLKLTETRVTVRSNLPFLKRAFYRTSQGSFWDPFYEANFRQVGVYTEASKIWQACRRCDLDEVRRLFTSGEASPYMENVRGQSLINDIIIQGIWHSPLAQSLSQLVELVMLLTDCSGRRGIAFDPSTVFMIMANQQRGYSAEKVEDMAVLLRHTLDRSIKDPLDDPNIAGLLDVEYSPNQLSSIIIEQNQWPFSLEPALDRSGFVSENFRQMLDDPYAEKIKKLLQRTQGYGIDLNNAPTDIKECHVFDRPICTLLSLASTTKRDDILTCCRSRLKLLLGMSNFHIVTPWEGLDFEIDALFDLRLTFANYWIKHWQTSPTHIGWHAVRNGSQELLESILREVGWTRPQLEDYFDRLIFHGIPELLDGDIVYKLGVDSRSAFIRDLCEGRLLRLSDYEIEALSFQITYSIPKNWWLVDGRDGLVRMATDLVTVVKLANSAFAARDMPGAWPEIENVGLLPRVDFPIDSPSGSLVVNLYNLYVARDRSEFVAFGGEHWMWDSLMDMSVLDGAI